MGGENQVDTFDKSWLSAFSKVHVFYVISSLFVAFLENLNFIHILPKTKP